VVDTGGIIPNDRELLPAEIYAQARIGIDESDAIIMVVDGRAPLTAPDIDLARILQRSGKPLLLAVNKMESERAIAEAESETRRLGIHDPHFAPAQQGLNVA